MNLRRMAWGVALALGLALIAANLLSIALAEDSWYDMQLLLQIVDGWWNGERALYPTTAEERQGPGFPSYRYPPVWGVSVVPLTTLFELRPAVAVWSLISLGLFFGGLAMVLRTTGVSWLSPATVGVVWLLAVLSPFYETYFGPTKELAMVGLMALTFGFAERQRSIAGGFTFSSAILMKVYPGFFGFYFLLRRAWPLLLFTAGWFLLLNLLPMPWIGADETVDFYLDILPRAGGSGAHSENASVEMFPMVGAWLRWFDTSIDPLDLLTFDRVGLVVGRVALLLAFAVVYGLVEQRPRSAPADRFLLFGAWVALVLLLIPVVWVNYQIFLILPFAGLVLWARAGVVRPFGLAATGCAVLAVALLSTPVNGALQARYVDPDMPRSHSISRSTAEGLWPEFESRIRHRSDRIAAIPGFRKFRARQVGDVAELLDRTGVPDADAPAADRDEIVEQLASAREAAGRSPSAAAEQALREAEVTARRAELSTREITRFFYLRPLAGLLAFLAALLAALDVWTRTPRPSVDGEA